MAKKKIVCLQSGTDLRYPDGKLVGGRTDENLMVRDGLFLTCGGRVVKPGCGEYASEDYNDILLLNAHEIEAGVSIKEFQRRWNAALRRRAARLNRLKKEDKLMRKRDRLARRA